MLSRFVTAFVTNAVHQFRLESPDKSDFSLEGAIVGRIRFPLILSCMARIKRIDSFVSYSSNKAETQLSDRAFLVIRSLDLQSASQLLNADSNPNVRIYLAT